MEVGSKGIKAFLADSRKDFSFCMAHRNACLSLITDLGEGKIEECQERVWFHREQFKAYQSQCLFGRGIWLVSGGIGSLTDTAMFLPVNYFQTLS